MVTTLYDINTLEAGTAKIEASPQDLRALVQSALASLGPSTAQAAIEWDRPPEPVAVDVDARMTVRVLANLIGNALRYTPEDQAVRITVEESETGVRIAVSDMGVVIPAERRGDVFEKFGQAKAWGQRKVYSSGLALAFCRLAVEAHGGGIGVCPVDETERKGNTFWITLPRGGSATSAEEER
jgi:K+-sensing histidine kinase KdpD